MDQGKRKLATSLLAAAALTTTAASLRAVTYVEGPGDAGQTIGTAQAAGAFSGTTGLTQINGTIAGTNGLDADVYSFTLNTATALTFTDISPLATAIDTSLFLFNSTGNALFGNDDRTTGFQAGFSTGLLAPGTYYLGVALSGNEAVNTANQLLFTAAGSPGTVRTAATGVNPATLGGFNGGTIFPEGGNYSIGVSVAVPEPGTNAALALGAAALGFTLVRRVRRQQAGA